MHFLPPLQTVGLDLRRAQVDAHRSASMQRDAQVDLIDPTYGLPLGCEAALPCLFDYIVEGTAHTD